MSSEYADQSRLAARQLLWTFRQPPFDLTSWVVDNAACTPQTVVLDAGCGNGRYLAEFERRGVPAVGCDLSLGMVRSVDHGRVVAADVQALPFADGTFDRVLAAHMLYHPPDRGRAIAELRRVLRDDGSCIVVTNGGSHAASVRAVVEAAVRSRTGMRWSMDDPNLRAFSVENGAQQLGSAFGTVRLLRTPSGHDVVVRDADVVADYVASLAGYYREQLPAAWTEIVADVRARVAAVIEQTGAFITAGDTACFVCS